jgi:hypothetical protein
MMLSLTLLQLLLHSRGPWFESLLSLCVPQVVVPHDPDVKIEDASLGEKWAIVSTRQRAQQTVTTCG